MSTLRRSCAGFLPRVRRVASRRSIHDGGEYRIILTYVELNPSTGKTTRDADVVPGRFLELVPDERIVQLVRFESDDANFAGEMKITWNLSPVSEGTRVDITAENVPIGITRADHEAGFSATLDNLAAFVEER